MLFPNEPHPIELMPHPVPLSLDHFEIHWKPADGSDLGEPVARVAWVVTEPGLIEWTYDRNRLDRWVLEFLVEHAVRRRLILVGLQDPWPTLREACREPCDLGDGVVALFRLADGTDPDAAKKVPFPV
ncbi:MAG: hypothetical protein FJ087_10765 [Deltaproteobacteria bacterium]|nr:hypothetical protein [Deltaproteobacteria bacterium]